MSATPPIGSSDTGKSGMARWFGRVALITGAASGIGASITDKLVRYGMKVIGCDIQSENLEVMQMQFKEDDSIKGTFEPFTCDLAKEDDILKMFRHIKSHHGSVDVCINSAGHSRNGPTLLEGNTADWRSLLEINVLALSICTREAIRQMREKGVDDGHVIHIGSGACHQVSPRPTLHFYSGTKFMVRALTEGLRQELREINSHIRISCICPPMVRTPFSYQILPDDPGTVDEWYAKDPSIEPEDVADAVIYALQAPPHVQVHDIIINAIPK
ncbi:dehydrogenase/reductase SDR family member 11-like [Amphiura filiformis]|uniref:dehydrogenase/reductase SDR family member 11-like n=1 Tax=Amphiura filiformis TaxID=82378 RepID=UPI003B20C9A3